MLVLDRVADYEGKDAIYPVRDIVGQLMLKIALCDNSGIDNLLDVVEALSRRGKNIMEMLKLMKCLVAEADIRVSAMVTLDVLCTFLATKKQKHAANTNRVANIVNNLFDATLHQSNNEAFQHYSAAVNKAVDVCAHLFSMALDKNVAVTLAQGLARIVTVSIVF